MKAKNNDLIKEIAKIEDIKWIKLLYCYPENVSDEMIELFKSEPKVCKYIDIPIQHTTSKILKLMGRKTTNEEIMKKIRNSDK